MNYIFFDDKDRNHLLPLTYTRPASDLRCGILNFREKWQSYFSNSFSFLTTKYLRKKYQFEVSESNLFINPLVFPNAEIIEKINSLKNNQALICSENQDVIAFLVSKDFAEKFNDIDFICIHDITDLELSEISIEYLKLKRTWEIFSFNNFAIEQDFNLLTKNRKSEKLSLTNRFVCEENIFIEEGARVEFATINAKNSKVYIGKNAEIMENASIRGSLALCENSELKMGAKIYGATTIGPNCKVGGEVNNSVFFGLANKAHDGFLGQAVIGEWCNLGADTNNSNLKNTYDIVKLWSYTEKQFVNTGLQFCGLIMGDHSKCGINTMFNTGTVIGVSANIYGAGFPRNYIPSFSWGGALGITKYNFNKAMQTAKAVYERRNVKLSDIDIEILKTIYEMSE